MPEHGYVLTKNGEIEAVNSVALEDLGASREDLISKPFHPMVLDSSRDSVFRMLSHLRKGEFVRGERVSFMIEGEPHEFAFSGTSLRDEDGGPHLNILVGRDISAIVNQARQNEYRAIHDRLTGVYNRWYLEEILNREEERAKRYRHSIAFIMMDIDSFKAINDHHGHMIGDAALKWVSDQLQSELRASDIVVRFGGDEFLLILPETNGEVSSIAERLLQSIATAGMQGVEPYLPMRVSLGTSTWHPSEDRSIEDALDEADREMYESRSRR